jgi:CRISPR-associated protein Cas1
MDLIIQKRGTSLAIKDGRFWVRGLDFEKTVPVGKVRSIQLHKATKLSYEVIAISMKHDIDVCFVDRKGFPIGRIWNHRFGSISLIRKNQLAFAASEEGICQVRQWLLQKIDQQQSILALLGLQQESMQKETALTSSKMERCRNLLSKTPVAEKDSAFQRYRGLEGKASSYYFAQISRLLPEQFAFQTRSRQPARDMFNATLNYAYGILYGKTEQVLIEAGIDPCIGILHRDEYNRPVLVYDFIEAYRHWADYVVIQLCMQQALFIEMFEVEQEGFYLGEDGRKILICSFNDYLDEVVLIEGTSRSRRTHLLLAARAFASKLKSFKN